MKKIVVPMLVLLLILVVVGCTNSGEQEDLESPAKGENESTIEAEVKPEKAAQAVEPSEIVQVGLGHVISTANSTGAEGDKTAKGQADTTVAAVGFDADGVIASVTLDVAQAKVDFDKDVKVTSDLEAQISSKKELKEEYGMKDASKIGKEWYEQVEAFEEWMVGRRVEDIVNMPVKGKDENHPAVPNVTDLQSSVTINVGDYIAAVEEAWDNAVDAEGAETIGLGFETSIANSKDALAQADNNIAATALDAEGNVVATIIDVAQVRVAFDEEGQLITDTTEEVKTKKELKEEYGMKDASEIGKEWYEQMQALEEWMSGKSIEDILDMPVKERDKDHPAVPDLAELESSVTINVGEYLSVVEESAEMAK